MWRSWTPLALLAGGDTMKLLFKTVQWLLKKLNKELPY
jgi:hypothetical protein